MGPLFWVFEILLMDLLVLLPEVVGLGLSLKEFVVLGVLLLMYQDLELRLPYQKLKKEDKE